MLELPSKPQIKETKEKQKGKTQENNPYRRTNTCSRFKNVKAGNKKKPTNQVVKEISKVKRSSGKRKTSTGDEIWKLLKSRRTDKDSIMSKN